MTAKTKRWLENHEFCGTSGLVDQWVGGVHHEGNEDVQHIHGELVPGQPLHLNFHLLSVNLSIEWTQPKLLLPPWTTTTPSWCAYHCSWWACRPVFQIGTAWCVHNCPWWTCMVPKYPNRPIVIKYRPFSNKIQAFYRIKQLKYAWIISIFFV